LKNKSGEEGSPKTKKRRPAGEFDEVETLRLRLWRSRASQTRPLGLFLVVLSGVLFAIALLGSYFVLEVASLSSFFVGIVMLARDLEPRVKLFSSAESLLGPLMSTVDLMQEKSLSGKALFRPEPGGVMMALESKNQPVSGISVRPVGQGPFDSYERELGDLKDKGLEYIMAWLPRAMVDGLDLAEGASMSVVASEVHTKLKKPFVRPLCVKPFMTENVCGTMGCPLVASIAQSLSAATNRPVSHIECVYDPTSQTAAAKHLIHEE
jgi:hypothetical protein